MSRLFFRRGPAQMVFAMANHHPRFTSRGHGGRGKSQKQEQNWRSLPVEGSAHWRRVTGADRRARRVKLLLILIVVLVGAAIGFLRG